METSKGTLYKYCVVPKCKNTSVRAPNKHYFNVPRDFYNRWKWCKVMGRDGIRNPKLSPKSHLYCCEDHFNLKNDTDNYMQYHLMQGVLGNKIALRLKKGTLPHIFHCQKETEVELEEIGLTKIREIETLSDEITPRNNSLHSITEDVQVEFSSPSTHASEDVEGGTDKMENDMKVFSSNITREQPKEYSDLYALIDLTPAKPLSYLNTDEHHSCDFRPKTDKHYEPRKNNKHKVKTVKDIRSLFEKDVYRYLPEDINRQQNILLKKIRAGSSKDGNTKQLAKDILKSDNPISRSAWQMLMNINPENYAHSMQYIMWNGKYIRINGSKGGRNKFICNYDLGRHKKQLKPNIVYKKTALKKKKKLLQNSLTIKFKPGPLGFKKYLDDSYQKYHVGNTELVKLPKPGLDIQPRYGCPVEPTITNFLNSLRDIDGSISKKWAEFSVSLLGTINDSNSVQIDEGSCVTFDLSYKYDQHRILMRRDFDSNANSSYQQYEVKSQPETGESNVILPQVRVMMEQILNCVEINLTQDNLYTGVEEPRSTSPDDTYSSGNCLSKEKLKKRYGELDRLDVTVITLPETSEQETPQNCLNAYCKFGCICASLKCPVILKNHCAHIDCMFECKCDFSKYKVTDTLNSECPEFIPGLINLDNEMNFKLAKEEQKFHQTVVVTGEKSILLKSRKRNWKTSKKYEDFYSNMCLKTETTITPVLIIVDKKINCDNIEPWCMVHNLYKCFCKGKFISSTNSSTNIHDALMNKPDSHIISESIVLDKNESFDTHDSLSSASNNIVQPRLRREVIKTNVEPPKVNCENNISLNSNYYSYYDTCARVKSYSGRKFSDGYYKNANYKIVELERNDRNLSKKLLRLCMQNETNNICNSNEIQVDSLVVGWNTNDIADETTKQFVDSSNQNVILSDLSSSFVGSTNKNKLIAWLEYSYKQFKTRYDRGNHSNTLQAPKPNKVALHPWEFILSRYRERKNHFLISKEQPYRIFMAVDTKHPFFLDCINIDDIRFADLHKYPATVKNLLTNATDLKDNFCILCGLTFCWEVIGSVAKICEPNNSSIEGDITNQNILSCDNSDLLEYLDDSDNSSNNSSNHTQNIKLRQNIADSPGSSKWFVMTVENDFTEIQFFNRGFFVKYESIVRSINIARMSSQTVRLSSQKCMGNKSNPQFGLYAVPNTNEYCVFVGPYELDEPLGIETIKSVLDDSKMKRTRGFWITTDKVDNLKVINNPMSFMPNSNAISKKVVNLEGAINSTPDLDTNKNDGSKSLIKNNKKVKPIKIKKDQFFKPFSLLKVARQDKISDTHSSSILNNCFVLNTNVTSPTKNSSGSLNSSIVDSDNFRLTPAICPSTSIDVTMIPTSIVSNYKIMEVDTLPIKITEVYSELNDASEKRNNTTSEIGMFILKPEEINQKIMKNKNTLHDVCDLDTSDKKLDSEISYSTASEVSQNNDVLVISDDEDNDNSNVADRKEVWIVCQNIKTLGWIQGRKNSKNLISFKIPGFDFSDFCVQEAAFSKINKILSRLIPVLQNIEIKWRVVELKSELDTICQLNIEESRTGFAKTSDESIPNLPENLKANIKTYSKKKVVESNSDNVNLDKIANNVLEID